MTPTPEPAANPKHPDMSPEAIDRRIRELSQLYRLGMSLQQVQWLGPANVKTPEESSPAASS